MARNQPSGESRDERTSVTIGIGGLAVRLEGTGVLSARVRKRYRRFLTDGAPDLTLRLRVGRDGEHRPSGMPEVTRAGSGWRILYGAMSARFDGAAGEAEIPPSIWLVDSLLRIVVGLMLAERGGLLVHGSGVRVGGGVLVCFGPSGVGKTTVARSAEAADVLCDEMIALLPDGRALGTPFHGDYPVCAPLSGPLLALVRLVQGPTDRLEPLSPAVAAQTLLNSTLFFCRDDAVAERLFAAAIQVCAHRTYRLTFQRGTHVPTFVSQELGSASASALAQAAGARDRR